MIFDAQTRINLSATFSAWQEKTNRTYALVSAVRDSLSTDENHAVNLQLLDIAEETLCDLSEFYRLAELFGVMV
ncbi:MAG: hypothetical protein WCG50_14385 [Rhodoferax sp.]|uniref:hypothetical protein n=1 Tax=Rhodoferax sp. TaxID=50421 RepID=UPI0030158CB2